MSTANTETHVAPRYFKKLKPWQGGGVIEVKCSRTKPLHKHLYRQEYKKKVTENTPCTCKLSVALDGCVIQSLQSVIVAVKLLHKHLYRQESKTKVEYLFYIKFFIKDE